MCTSYCQQICTLNFYSWVLCFCDICDTVWKWQSFAVARDTDEAYVWKMYVFTHEGALSGPEFPQDFIYFSCVCKEEKRGRESTGSLRYGYGSGAGRTVPPGLAWVGEYSER